MIIEPKQTILNLIQPDYSSNQTCNQTLPSRHSSMSVLSDSVRRQHRRERLSGTSIALERTTEC